MTREAKPTSGDDATRATGETPAAGERPREAAPPVTADAETGDVRGLRAALEEATAAQERAEDALRDSETRLRDLALSSADWIWEVDAGGRYVACSERVRDALGFGPDELIGKTPFDLMVAEDAERLGPVFQGMIAEARGCSGLVNRNLHKDGHEVILATSCVPIVDAEGRLTGFRGVDKDITGSVRAEQELRENEERYRRMFDLDPDGLLVIDRGTLRVVEANDAASSMYGYSKEELTGLAITDLSAEPEATRAMIATVSGAEGTHVPLRRHRRKDGRVFPVEITAATISVGGRTLISQAIRDVSERERRASYVAAVAEIQRRLLSADEDGSGYELVLAPILVATRADHVRIFENRRDEHGHLVADEVAVLASSGAPADKDGPELRGVRLEDLGSDWFETLRRGDHIAGSVAALAPEHRSVAERLGIDSVLVNPLMVNGEFYGSLMLDSADEREWGFLDLALVTTAATAVASAAERRMAMAALRHRTAELSALLGASRAIASTIEFDAVLRQIARAAGEALGSPECVIWEHLAGRGMAEFRCLWERDPKPGVAESLAGSSYSINTHSGGMATLRAGVVVQQSLSDPGLAPGDRADMEEWGEKTWLTVPLVFDEELLGVMILVETAHERVFTPDEIRMAGAIGEQAAVALSNARMHRGMEAQNRWLRALLAAGRAVASTLDAEELLANVARLAAEAILAPVAFIYEYDAANDVFVTRSRYGAEGVGRVDPIGSIDSVSDAPDDRRALDAGQVFVETLSDPGIDEHVRRKMMETGEKTLLNVPFRFKGEALGMLVLIETESERTYSEQEMEFMSAFGEQVAVALNNARLYSTIELQATTDGLTGLANHRTFYDRLEQELARARRYGTMLSLLMIDIDDFKALNDTHGHLAGDEVLRLLGAELVDQLRRGVDLPARYGGEEFAVLLPNTPATPRREAERDEPPRPDGGTPAPGHREGAEALAERLRARIAALPLPIGAGGAIEHITVSIGVASFPDMAAEMDELVAHADAALYAAKRAGKNAVEVYWR